MVLLKINHCFTSFSHWLVEQNRGVSSGLPLQQQVSLMIDGINQLPARPLFFPQGHIIDL